MRTWRTHRASVEVEDREGEADDEAMCTRSTTRPPGAGSKRSTSALRSTARRRVARAARCRYAPRRRRLMFTADRWLPNHGPRDHYAPDIVVATHRQVTWRWLTSRAPTGLFVRSSFGRGPRRTNSPASRIASSVTHDRSAASGMRMLSWAVRVELPRKRVALGARPVVGERARG